MWTPDQSRSQHRPAVSGRREKDQGGHSHPTPKAVYEPLLCHVRSTESTFTYAFYVFFPFTQKLSFLSWFILKTLTSCFSIVQEKRSFCKAMTYCKPASEGHSLRGSKVKNFLSPPTVSVISHFKCKNSRTYSTASVNNLYLLWLC